MNPQSRDDGIRRKVDPQKPLKILCKRCHEDILTCSRLAASSTSGELNERGNFVLRRTCTRSHPLLEGRELMAPCTTSCLVQDGNTLSCTYAGGSLYLRPRRGKFDRGYCTWKEDFTFSVCHRNSLQDAYDTEHYVPTYRQHGPRFSSPSALDKYYRGTSVLNIMRTCKARTKRELNFRVVVACHVARPVGLKVEGGAAYSLSRGDLPVGFSFQEGLARVRACGGNSEMLR